MNSYNPSNDGLDHVNVSLDSRSELGVLLSMEHQREFKVGDIKFSSLYQYWIWLNRDKDSAILELESWKRYPRLMKPSMFGFKELPGARQEFTKTMIRVFREDKKLMQQLKNNQLPLVQYSSIMLDGVPTVIRINRPWYMLAIAEVLPKEGEGKK